MKKGFTAVAILVLSAMIYQSCDYVSHAVPTANPNSTTTTTGTSAVVYRKVLIEDYTGHKCGNCPAAARELRKLDSLNPGKIVPIAVHAGFYANVTPTSNPPYPTDLRSQAGTDYDTYFGNSAAGNPNGLVNRVGYGSANFIKQWGDWGTAALSMDTLPADFKITISNTYNATSNQVSTTVTTKAIKAKTGTYNLTIVLTEDSIIAEQIDYSITSGSQYMTNYVFNHVLRGALNSSWGAPIITGSINAGDSIKTTVSNYQLGSAWKWKHCHIVAYIYDAASGSPTQYEILQAEEKDLQ